MNTLGIDLFHAVCGTFNRDNFTTLLFRLMLKSDSQNLAKLGIGYPVECEMIRLFRALPEGPEGEELTREQELKQYELLAEVAERNVKARTGG